MPNLPYILTGKVYDTDGATILSNIKVTARNERSNVSLSTNTDSTGDYVLDLANFTGGYNVSYIVTVFVVYSNFEDNEEHTVTQADGGATINLTLVIIPASDQLRYFTVQEYFDFFHLTAGASQSPATKEVVLVGLGVEDELDRVCSTRFSDGAIETEVDDCDATTGWSGSTDAAAIAVSTDDADYKTRSGALDLGKSGATEAFFTYSKSSLVSRNFTNKVVVCMLNLTALTGLRAVDNGSAITIRYGSSSSNYYEKSWYYGDLLASWNVLYFKLDDGDVTTAGTPNPSDMTYFQVRFDTVASTTTITSGVFTMDNIFLVHEDHFQDEYFDTKDVRQRDYFLRKLPVHKLVQLLVNRGDEDQSPSWDELTETDNEIKMDKQTGRITVIDVVSSSIEARNIFGLLIHFD